MKAKNFTKVREWVAENMAQGVSDTQVVSLIYKEMKEHFKATTLPHVVLILADYQAKAAVAANQEVNTVAMCVEIMMNPGDSYYGLVYLRTVSAPCRAGACFSSCGTALFTAAAILLLW